VLTDAQEVLGKARLVGDDPHKRLKAGDVADLVSAFRVWLVDRAGEYPDMAARLAAAEDDIAAKLAGSLLLLKGMGFSVSNLTGGSLGISSVKQDKRSLIVRYAFGLLYDLTEFFEGQGSTPKSTAVENQTSF
jgi:hypothetical protein